MTTELGTFANTIFKRTYAFTEDETWDGCAARVAKYVANGDESLERDFFDVISTRKFIPGGRYLYASGREIPQLYNCFLMKAEDSREGWARLVDRHVRALSTGGGVGTEYCLGLGTLILTAQGHWQPVEKLEVGDELIGFGEAPLRLDKNNFEKSTVTSSSIIKRPSYRIVTTKGEVIASAEHLWVARTEKRYGIRKKKTESYKWRATDTLKVGMEVAFTSEPWREEPRGFNLGWLSGMLDGEGWVSQKKDKCGQLGIAQNEGIILDKIESLLKEYNINYSKHNQNGGRGNCYTLTMSGKWNALKLLSLTRPARLISKLEELWMGGKVGRSTQPAKIIKIEFLGEQPVVALGTSTKTLIANGFLSHNSQIREKGQPIKRFGGVSSGPISLMCMVNEIARHVMAGGKRRSALWAGLAWWHPDVKEFIQVKNWSMSVRAIKEKDFNFPAHLDMTNISVRLDDSFFKKIKKDDSLEQLYYQICKSMCKTGEPGFSIDVGADKTNILRNPCTEVVSDTDSDCCNLGSINFSCIGSIDELERVTRIAVRFLYNGTFISWMPHEDYYNVRNQNRRVGLGLMGLHEWCIRNGQIYEPTGLLGKWLTAWAKVSDEEADKYSNKLNNVRPVAVRAIAPTGTIGIIGETSTGIEPVFCVSYKRRFLDKDGKWKFMYVIDPTVEKLVTELGVDPNDIEDSVSLARDVERRLAMQAFVQDFVDQAISSTINLPEWGEPGNNNAKEFSRILLKYLPKLRGLTVYPDASRPGQPIVPVKYETAKGKSDVVYEEDEDRCSGGVCGI